LRLPHGQFLLKKVLVQDIGLDFKITPAETRNHHADWAATLGTIAKISPPHGSRRGSQRWVDVTVRPSVSSLGLTGSASAHDDWGEDVYPVPRRSRRQTGSESFANGLSGQVPVCAWPAHDL